MAVFPDSTSVPKSSPKNRSRGRVPGFELSRALDEFYDATYILEGANLLICEGYSDEVSSNAIQCIMRAGLNTLNSALGKLEVSIEYSRKVRQ